MDLETTARRQGGVVSRAQALAELTPEAVRHRLEVGRWRRLHPGIYLTHAGETDWLARAHAALLHCGPEAALELHSAAYILGLLNTPPPVINVVVPARRRPRRLPGVRVRRSRATDTVQRQGLRVTAPARTVLDLADEDGVTSEKAVGILADAVRTRVVSAAGLVEALRARKRHQHRRALRLGLGDIDAGTQSLLEVKALRRIFRDHRLPVFDLQAPDAEGRVRRDFGCAEFGVILEVDGQIGHLGSGRLADYRRDRAAARSGQITLRAGWSDVDEAPCDLALDLFGALAARGYTGAITPCGPECGLSRGLSQNA